MSARHRAPAAPAKRVRNRPPQPVQPAQPSQPSQPSRPSRLELRNAPALVVVVLAGLGLAYVAVAPKHWLRGVLVMAFAMGVAALLRIALPARQAGLLAVRSRFLDALWYTGIAAAMVILGLWLRASGRT